MPVSKSPIIKRCNNFTVAEPTMKQPSMKLQLRSMTGIEMKMAEAKRDRSESPEIVDEMRVCAPHPR